MADTRHKNHVLSFSSSHILAEKKNIAEKGHSLNCSSYLTIGSFQINPQKIVDCIFIFILLKCQPKHLPTLYLQVAWLHSEKGTLAVYPHVITQNDRISVSSDHRNTYNLKLRDIRESDAGVYICQINTGPAISISGALTVVGI